MLVYRWEPSFRMTPDQALKHSWIHEPRNLKPRSRPQTLRKASLCLPSEAPKAKVPGHHHLDISGTAPQIASPFPVVWCSGISGGFMSVSLNSTLDSFSDYITTSLSFLTFEIQPLSGDFFLAGFASFLPLYN